MYRNNKRKSTGKYSSSFPQWIHEIFDVWNEYLLLLIYLDVVMIFFERLSQLDLDALSDCFRLSETCLRLMRFRLVWNWLLMDIFRQDIYHRWENPNWKNFSKKHHLRWLHLNPYQKVGNFNSSLESFVNKKTWKATVILLH